MSPMTMFHSVFLLFCGLTFCVQFSVPLPQHHIDEYHACVHKIKEKAEEEDKSVCVQHKQLDELTDETDQIANEDDDFKHQTFPFCSARYV